MATKVPTVFSLQQAVSGSSVLQRLHSQVAQSQRLWQAVQPHIPAQLRTSIKPSRVQEGKWTLLVPHNSAAAKLRQILPDLLSAAQRCDDRVQAVHLSVSPSSFTAQ